MNIRKNVDYTDMYAALDSAMEKNLSQVELYYEIGGAVCQRTEKGAAVAAAAYLYEQYPNIQGFSPRNLRRMRDFYRAYEDQPALLSLALRLGWTQNVVILEADLPMELRGWYLRAASQFGWSKAELIEKTATNAYEVISHTIDKEGCDIEEKEEAINHKEFGDLSSKKNKNRYLFHRDQMADEVNERKQTTMAPNNISQILVERIESAVISFATVLEQGSLRKRCLLSTST